MKRLAKLQNQAPVHQREGGSGGGDAASVAEKAPAQSATPAEAQGGSEQSHEPSAISSSSAALTTADSIGTFPSQPETELATGEPKIRISPASARSESAKANRETPAGGSRPDSSAGRSQSTRSAPAESLEIWEDRALGNIFRITLNEAQHQDGHGHSLRFLPGVRAELEEQGENVRLSLPVLEQAILEAASKPNGAPPLDYLLACWKRVTRQFRGMRSDDPKHTVVKEARRLCMSYCIFAITMPEMFGFVS